MVVVACLVVNILLGRSLWLFSFDGDLVMALTVPQATLIGMWITLLETSRKRRLNFVTWLIAAIIRSSSMALFLGAMLLTINNTCLGGFVWDELVYVGVLPMLVATAIGTLLRYLIGIRLAAVESGGPGGTFTITDLFACLALIGLVIAIFRILPELEFVVVDTSLTPIFATLTASLAMYLGAAWKRCSFLVGLRLRCGSAISRRAHLHPYRFIRKLGLAVVAV